MIGLSMAYQPWFVADKVGATMAGYALLVAFVAVVVVAGALFFGRQISEKFRQVGDLLGVTWVAWLKGNREENRARRGEIESKRWSQVQAASNEVADTDPQDVEARLRNLSHGTYRE